MLEPNQGPAAPAPGPFLWAEGAAMKRVLLIGATGQFGARLARLLCEEPGLQLVLAGRTAQSLAALAAKLGGAEWLVVDRLTLTADALMAQRIDSVVDASGPFALDQTGLVDVCQSAAIAYFDLADNRAFVAAFANRATGTATAITGASSTPALSNAAAAAITAGWLRIDTLRVAISPANRQPRGRAVIASVLASAGQAFDYWQGGRWRRGHGWADLSRIDFPHVGTRWASRFDAPDHDQLVAAFKPSQSAEFYAGLEHPVMHLGLTLMTALVRLHLIANLAPLAAALHWVADRMIDYGNNRGGMVVEATGQDATGHPAATRWWLAADGESGPHVPILAILAVLRKWRDGALPLAATACVGLLTLDDFAGDFARLGIETGIENLTPITADQAH